MSMYVNRISDEVTIRYAHGKISITQALLDYGEPINPTVEISDKHLYAIIHALKDVDKIKNETW